MLLPIVKMKFSDEMGVEIQFLFYKIFLASPQLLSVHSLRDMVVKDPTNKVTNNLLFLNLAKKFCFCF